MTQKSARLAALLVIASGCAHRVLERPPPLDLRDRQRAEAAACWSGKLPYWLDDAALADAAQRDGREGDASRANESFEPGTAMRAASPPPLGRAGTGGRHQSALLSERREFQDRCALLRAEQPRLR
ncbi:hypothetical protein [Anaeromyxobacter paludicola]|uniref:Lipoprotein n=1 Tax=Anaeromyxobacter paludicola TaxID=2918171 RepID=A0ABN6N5B0_9BACT|nr:hypothetical protein [Anaeromyxobacter paludicola]BDG08206.1 hypothetical protein AMPC_13190 [Anaeromyxobacter paludicola]